MSIFALKIIIYSSRLQKYSEKVKLTHVIISLSFPFWIHVLYSVAKTCIIVKMSRAFQKNLLVWDSIKRLFVFSSLRSNCGWAKRTCCAESFRYNYLCFSILWLKQYHNFTSCKILKINISIKFGYSKR